MAYNDNIPNSGDLISTSQGQIKSNFQAIDSSVFGFARNHVPLTNGTSGGLHTEVDFVSVIPDPGPTISGFVSSVYSRFVTPQNELMYKNFSATTQITSLGKPIWKGGTVGTDGVVTETNSGNGGMNLPNGIQFRWGSASVSTSGTSISYATAFSNGAYSVTVTPQSNTSRTSAVSGVGSASSFTAYSENNGTTMYYFAVGH